MKENAKKEILNICVLLKSGNVDFIEGCRKVVYLRNQYGLSEDLSFSPFVGVVSETDDYPDQRAREGFSKDYLERIDKDIMDYVSLVRPSIIEACDVLIEKYK